MWEAWEKVLNKMTGCQYLEPLKGCYDNENNQNFNQKLLAKKHLFGEIKVNFRLKK